MTYTKVVRRSFAGGEITPEMYGRLDNIKNQTGLALCRNAIVLPHGPASKRPGFGFVNVARGFTMRVRVLPFVFSATQSMVLEFSNQTIRFHTAGAALLEAAGAIVSIAGNTVNQTAHGYAVGDWVWIGNRFFRVASVLANSYTVADTITGAAATPVGTTAARVYTISSPYTEAELFDLKFTQDADVLTITHPNYVPRELRRLGATNWTLTAPTLGSAVTVPTGPGAVPTAGTGTAYPKDHYYQITAVSPDGTEESLPTASVTASCDLTLPGSKNTVSWVSVGAGYSYRVYKAVGSSARLHGFVGETTGTSFVDDNILPDYSRNPPAGTLRLDTVGNCPAAVTYFDQRRVFAGTTNDPQAVFMTRVGTESNLNVSNPTQSGDAINFRIKAQQQNAIRHLVPLDDLLALTAGGIWRIYPADDRALVAGGVAARPQSYDGASQVTPILASSSVLFVESNGKRVRDIGYSTEARSYITDDRSIIAPHLFNDYTLTDSAFQRAPDKIAWYTRSDGQLLSLTYLPEQQVWAWAQHRTDGFFESVCVVPEDNKDVLYAVVRRTLQGVSCRVIERMAPREFATQADAFFVDCAMSYSGAPVTTLSGIWHLEGESLVALADGGVVTGLTVTDGAITLPIAASKVQVGRRFVADIQTLPLAVEAAAAAGQGTIKSISDVYLRVSRSGVMKVGPNEDELVDIPWRTNEPYDTPPRLRSEEMDVLIEPDWTRDAQIWVQSNDPVPMTVSTVTMKVHLAG